MGLPDNSQSLTFLSDIKHSSTFTEKRQHVRVLDHERNNESSILIYNLAVMKNSKMKIYTQDKSREKQKSSVKITLTAPELALKGNISKLNFKRD